MLARRAKSASDEWHKKMGHGSRIGGMMAKPELCFWFYSFAGSLDSQDSASVARILGASIAQETDVEVRWWLMAGLSIVGRNMDPAAWTAICGPFAKQMAQLLADSNDLDVVRTFSTFASKLSPLPASQAVIVWQDALDRERDAFRRLHLLSLLVAAAKQTAPRDRSVISGRLARLITDELKSPTARESWLFAKLAASTAEGMNPVDAVQYLLDSLERETNRAARLYLAEGLATVVGRMDPLEADRVCQRQIEPLLKSLLSQTLTDASDNYTLYEIVPTMLPHLDHGKANGLAWEVAVQMCSEPNVDHKLTKVLADANRTQTTGRAPLMTAATIEQPMTGPTPASPSLVAEPSPCRFTAQELLELLKMPTCFGETRRVVLDQLGNRYGQRFVNHWAFVRFARAQNLDLDFTTPPKRPDPRESVKRMLEILDGPK
jgi:hypothetical protein